MLKRRNLLQLLAMLPLSSGVFGVVSSLARAEISPGRGQRRVRPSDANWPSAASWIKLKAEVGGHLIEPKPLFGSCAAEPGGSACLEAHRNLSNPFWIGDQPAGTEVSGWINAWTPAPSVYGITTRNAADVAAGVNFARENNCRLVVKGAATAIWARPTHRIPCSSGRAP